MRKLIAKLMGWHEQRANFPKRTFEANQKAVAKEKREKIEEDERGRGVDYAPDRTVPSESEILGPSESKNK